MSVEVRYTVTVYLTQPIDSDDDPQAYLSAESKRSVEKDIIRALGKLDGDADCEVQEAELLRDYDSERDEAYERAAHRARMNDFEDTGGKDWT